MAAILLMVEDEELVRGVVADELRAAGFAVVEAADAAEALAALESQPIDALFTDIRLPGEGDGWTIAEAARARKPGLPVLYATGYSAAAPRQVPGGRLLLKPYRVRNVIAALAEMGVAPQPA